MDLGDLFKKPEGISLVGDTCWRVSPPAAPGVFVRALAQWLPPDSILHLEGTSSAEDVRAFLTSRRVESGVKVSAGTLWPKPEVFHVEADPETLERLAHFFDTYPVPEICDHFHVLSGERILLEWHDAFFHDPFYIAGDVMEVWVRLLAEAIGSAYERTSLVV